MSWFTLDFDRPEYLWLLLLAPAACWFGWQHMGRVTGPRKVVALLLRSALIVLLVMALAEAQVVRITQRVAAFVLLDQSHSVPAAQRQQSFAYASTATEAHRDKSRGDMTGLIVFGKEAQIEQPVVDDGLRVSRVESAIDPNQSNLQSALHMAGAAFPEGVARRVVLVSDGNQTIGDVMSEAQSLVGQGIGIDVALLPSLAQADVVLEKLAVRASARIDSPFEATAVVSNYPAPGDGRPASGRIRISRRGGGQETAIAEQQVSMGPGKHVYSFRQELSDPGFYAYEARFIPDDPQSDQFAQNNRATAFTHVQGRERVLFIVNSESPDEYQPLVELLKRNGILVTVQTTAAPFASLLELQEYDSVVLANVPRVAGDGAEQLVGFTDEQVHMLVQNTHEMGAGLVMLGGPDTFGAGGWTNTELEKAMPVDFQVKNLKVQALGALLLVIDKSGSMSGQKLQMSKAAARAAVDMLGTRDQVGVIAFDSGAQEVVRLQKVGNSRDQIQSSIGRIAEGGGTDMSAAVQLGYERLLAAEASVKHMIVLTDGQTAGSGYEQIAARMRQQGITTTAVAIGPDAAHGLLQSIARHGAGKYYQVTRPTAVPRIFMRETRRVMRPVVFESSQAFAPQVVLSHEVLRGAEAKLPPINGYILTTPKDHSLVELVAVLPEPGGQKNPLIATWAHGAGRTAVFTTDAGRRWAKSWPEWDHYERFFVQLVRWSLRRIEQGGEFQLTTDVQEGRVRVVVQAQSAAGDPLNNLPLVGRLTTDAAQEGPPLKFVQIAPGRYLAGTAELVNPGSYLVSVSPGPNHPLLRGGIDMPLTREFHDRETNERLLIALASLTPVEGAPGEVIRLPEDPATWSTFYGPDIFRGDLPHGRRPEPVWSSLVYFVAFLLLADVANRRLIFPSPWSFATKWLAARAARNRATLPDDKRLARLKAQKSAATQEYSSAAEFEPQSIDLRSTETAIDAIERASTLTDKGPHRPTSADGESSDLEPLTYSERLLRAKRQANERKR